MVYDPSKDELFRRTGGMVLTSTTGASGSLPPAVEPVSLRNRHPVSRSGDHDTYAEQMKAVIGVSSGVRRFEAAALGLAYVAAGQVDGFWKRSSLGHRGRGASGPRGWRIRHGLLGRNNSLKSGDVVAANDRIHPFLKLLRDSERPAADPPKPDWCDLTAVRDLGSVVACGLGLVFRAGEFVESGVDETSVQCVLPVGLWPLHNGDTAACRSDRSGVRSRDHL